MGQNKRGVIGREELGEAVNRLVSDQSKQPQCVKEVINILILNNS